MEEIEKIRREGIAVSYAEHMDFGCTMSVPIRDFTGNIIACMSVSWVGSETGDKEKEDYLKTKLQAAAKELCGLLGYSGN